jgi:hypothetical protein
MLSMLRKTILSGLFLTWFLPVLSNPVFVAAGGSDEDVATWVRDRVEALQPTAVEKRLDEIGWAKSISEAEKLARQHNRPVFLFTHNGSMGTGRC